MTGKWQIHPEIELDIRNKQQETMGILQHKVHLEHSRNLPDNK